jgi:hypothetical protein
VAVIGALIDWWRRRGFTSPRFPRVTSVESMSTMPDRLLRRVVYVVGRPERPSWAVFTCPCGTGHLVQINLDPNRPHPAWKVTRTDRGPTLRPSVDVHGEDRRCHYWLRAGTVDWTPSAR